MLIRSVASGPSFFKTGSTTVCIKELCTTPLAKLLLIIASKRDAVSRDASLVSRGCTSSTGEPDGFILDSNSPNSFKESRLKLVIDLFGD